MNKLPPSSTLLVAFVRKPWNSQAQLPQTQCQRLFVQIIFSQIIFSQIIFSQIIFSSKFMP